MCLGPGTAIQVSGKLFCRKIGPLICFADFVRMSSLIGGGGGARNSAMDVDHIDPYPAGALVNFQPSGDSIVPAKIVLATGGAGAVTFCFANLLGRSDTEHRERSMA